MSTLFRRKNGDLRKKPGEFIKQAFGDNFNLPTQEQIQNQQLRRQITKREDAEYLTSTTRITL